MTIIEEIKFKIIVETNKGTFSKELDSVEDAKHLLNKLDNSKNDDEFVSNLELEN